MTNLDFTTPTPVRYLNTDFIGREYAFKRIDKLWSIPAGTPRSMLFWGDHCIGKSTVLWNASKNLQATFVTYTNLQCLGCDRETKYVWLALAHALEKVDSIVFIEDDIFEKEPYTVFSEYVEQFLVRHPERKLLLAIDEYEVFLEIPESTTVLKQLEALTLKHDRLAFLLCGGHNISRVNIEFKPTLNFWMGFFTREETAQFVKQQPYDFSEDAIERLYRLTNGQPWLLRGSCFNIIQKFNQMTEEEHEIALVSVYDVAEITNTDEFYGNHRYYFADLWGKPISCQDITLRKVLKILAHEPCGLTVNEIARVIGTRHTLPIHEVCQNAMEYHPGSLIEKRNNHGDEIYYVAIKLFRRWIIRTQK